MPVTCRGRADQPSTTRAEPIGSAAGRNHANRNSQVPPLKTAVNPVSSAKLSTVWLGSRTRRRPRLPGSASTGRRARRLRHRDNARRRVSRVLYRLASSRAATRGSGDGHSSGTPVAGRLVRPTRAAARRPARRRRARIAPGGRRPPLLFGLAPGGVFHAAAVAGGAVRSYRTVSPLPPARLAGAGSAVCFLWHFPWGRPRRALPGTVPPWSPDFPLRAA